MDIWPFVAKWIKQDSSVYIVWVHTCSNQYISITVIQCFSTYNKNDKIIWIPSYGHDAYGNTITAAKTWCYLYSIKVIKPSLSIPNFPSHIQCLKVACADYSGIEKHDEIPEAGRGGVVRLQWVVQLGQMGGTVGEKYLCGSKAAIYYCLLTVLSPLVYSSSLSSLPSLPVLCRWLSGTSV